MSTLRSTLLFTPLFTLLGCGQPLDGFGIAGEAYVTVADAGEDGWFAFGFVRQATASCEASSASSGSGSPVGDDLCSFMLEVAQEGASGISSNSNRFDSVSFSFEAVADEAELWGSAASVVEDAPCYGDDFDSATFEAADATVTLPDEPDGETATLTFNGDYKGDIVATLCR